MSSGISTAFAALSQIQGQITHALLTRAPLYLPQQAEVFSCDLHVLSTPPAFILSQDQTLQLQSGLSAVYPLGPTRFNCHYLVFKDQNSAHAACLTKLSITDKLARSEPFIILSVHRLSRSF